MKIFQSLFLIIFASTINFAQPEKGNVGVSAQIQSQQLDFLIPFFVNDNLSFSPSLGCPQTLLVSTPPNVFFVSDRFVTRTWWLPLKRNSENPRWSGVWSVWMVFFGAVPIGWWFASTRTTCSSISAPTWWRSKYPHFIRVVLYRWAMGAASDAADTFDVSLLSLPEL